MTIEAPYSLELAKGEVTAAAVVGTTADVVPGKMKLYLGANVPPGKRTSYASSLLSCFARLKDDGLIDGTGADVVASGPWNASTSGNITIASDTAGVADDSVAIVIAGDFANGSHFYKAAFDRLLAALTERTKDN